MRILAGLIPISRSAACCVRNGIAYGVSSWSAYTGDGATCARSNGVVARQSCSQTNAAQGGHAHRVTVAFRERAEQLLALPDAVSRLLQLRLDLCEPLLLLRLPRAGTQA